ncbi:hypothetical protein Nepgr_015980 [Nepenthes gracilis]|uniref:Uncharacterized protein n=1 Tax=Nepenthes gracilis TaxID=150966 RepID=A0AAD3SNX2_NEPGR|nr:hypothetical protein Nepgr_015980 [Nepenthes gracilis]
MGKKAATRRELLERWRAIEEEEDDDEDSLKIDRLRQVKEQWFSDAYTFLISSPKDIHIWCEYWEIMSPLLETFYNFFKVEYRDSPLKSLWERMSQEMRRCTQCVSQHHRAQEMYREDYELSVVSPLLVILQSLDEERVTQHLTEVNARIARGVYDPGPDNAETISVMFEVLTFPILLDDQSLVNEFQIFIEAVDNVHDLTFAKKQHFPGVYALLFLKSRRVRSIGLRLAGNMEKLGYAADMEPLQPLLGKYIGFLATELMPSNSEISRPRVQLDRMTVWLGTKALLGFLKPAALEEGILEPYPVFLNLVLEHISDDSPEFSHAVNCMRQLLEILGCNLWLRTSLPPSVMCDSLLSQCFHTRNEKTHKDIFELFCPFLQSLEALQDGEFEKQRRHFLYFLLHQVTRSSNFSALMRKKACQIAILIIHRGYKMNPPCPPSECAHMWGPTLVSSLKDITLHSSLRQPAIDLIQTIIVSDAAALISSMFHCQMHPGTGNNFFIELIEETDDALPYAVVTEETAISCWNEFSFQSTIIAGDEWMCVPMLWFDVLVEINPSILPVSFSKAVMWALSRFSMLESETNTDMSLPIKTWLSSSATEVSSYFGWKCPTGSNNGGDSEKSKNSARVSTMCISLIKTFRRLAAHFVVQMEGQELWKQWTWEPQMGECLILLLAEPNDNTRQLARRIMEHVSNTRGLAYSLQFLCSCESSISAIFLGLRHALKLVQLDIVLANFQTLHHFFFLLYKVLKEGVLPSLVEKKSLDNFSSELAKVAWPSVKKCLQEGKAFIDCRISQMTCIRVLEILPIIFGELSKSSYGPFGKSGKMIEDNRDFCWLLDLVEWVNSSLEVVVRYWKQCVNSLLDLLKGLCSDKSATIICAIERMVSCDAVPVDLLTEQVSQLSVSLSTKASKNVDKPKLSLKVSGSEDSAAARNCSHLDVNSHSQYDADVEILRMTTIEMKNADCVIVLSDDEKENQISLINQVLSDGDPSHCISDGNMFTPNAEKQVSQGSHGMQNFPKVVNSSNLQELFQKVSGNEGVHLASVSDKAETIRDFLKTASLHQPKETDSGKREMNAKSSSNECIQSLDKTTTKNSSAATSQTEYSNNVCNLMGSGTNDSILKDLVCDAEDDHLDLVLKFSRSNQPSLSKHGSGFSVPKRQVIQLKVPVENRSGYVHKLEAGARRFKPAKLDDWFRLILEMDYFATVGLASSIEEENKTVSELKEVPVSFESPEQYVDIFRPLVLEEFKAQLRTSFQEMSSVEEMSCGSLSVVSVERIDDFHLVRCVHDDHDFASSSSCLENDLVLLTKQPLKNSPHNVHMVGKLERFEKDNKKRLNILVIRLYLQSGYSRLNRVRKQLLERSKWFLNRIMSITPQLREFQALSSIRVIPALPVILRPRYHPLVYSESGKIDLGKLSQPMQQVLTSTFNGSQLQAISTVLQSPDIENSFQLSLVQGPPGTGKTRTIVAIISALLVQHSSHSNAMERKISGSTKPSITTPTNPRMQISQSAAIARAWQDAALARQLDNDAQKEMKLVKTCVRKRVLVCAQSNAATDELLSRVTSEGLYGADGNMYKPYIVRVGNAKAVHPNSLPFFIDTLVDHRLTEERMNTGDVKNYLSGDASVTLRSALEKIADHIRFYESKRANLKDGGSDMKFAVEDEKSERGDGKAMSAVELEAKLRYLYEQKKEIYMKLAATQAREKKINEDMKALRNKLRRSILREAEIVVTTLSGCGGDLYAVCSESALSCKMGNVSEQSLFDAVVIDEAAQALEPATLIPLQLLKSSGTKCIMVGDPKQLPATVLSNVASKYLYECSMFERLQRAGSPVILLTEQYRMHPEICCFPSLYFYDGKLLNGVSLSSKMAPFHKTKGLGPYVFYDVIDGQECYGKNSGSSLYNEGEADAAVLILKHFKDRYHSEFASGRIGIITPYKSQLSLLRSRFSSEFGSSIMSEIEFNTIDGFQGREVDILVLSTVRAADPTAPRANSSVIGFVADVRRMNVALTRARFSLWILGNARTLQTNSDWDALIKNAKRRNLVVSVKKPYKSSLKIILESSSINETSGDLGSQETASVKVERCQKNRRENNKQTHERKSTRVLGSVSGKKRKDENEHHSLAATDEADKIKRIVDTGGKGKEHWEKKLGLQNTQRRGKVVNDSSGDLGNQQRISEKAELSQNARQSESNKQTHERKSTRVLSGGSGKKRKEEKEHHISAATDCTQNNERRVDIGGKGKERYSKKIDLENSQRTGKGVNHSDRGARGRNECSKLQVSEGHKLPVQHAKNQTNKNVSMPIVRGSKIQSKDMDVGGQPSNDACMPKDFIAKRKRQRDAVDALLSSALISAKKSETSKKSMPNKSHLSAASNVAADSAPSKQRKGPCA